MAGAPDELPDLSGLPGWVQGLAYVVLAASLGVVGLMARFGWIFGKAAPPGQASSSRAEVAAVIVDPEALNRATNAVLKLDTTLGQLRDLVGQYVADQHEDREVREIEEEVERRVAERARTRRRRPTKRPAG